MINCCDTNMDGKVILNGKLDSPQITNGKLLDTQIGVDCAGNPVMANSAIATCKNLTQATVDLEAKKQDNLLDTHNNPLATHAVVLQPEDLTAVTTQLGSKQDGLKGLDGKPLEGGTAVVDKDSFEALKTAKQDALMNCEGKPFGVGEKVPSCDEFNSALDKKQDGLKGLDGKPLEGGAAVVDKDSFETLKTAKQDALTNCAGKPFSAGEKVPSCDEFNSALDKKQDALKSDTGAPLAGGTSVVSLAKFEAMVNTIQSAIAGINNTLRDDKQDNLLDCNGKRLVTSDMVVKCTDLEAAKTELKDEIGKVSGANFKRGDGSPMKGTESLPTYDEFTDQVGKINNSITDFDKKINGILSSPLSTQMQVAATELASASNGGTLPTLIAGGTDVLLGRPDLLLEIDLGSPDIGGPGTFYLPLFKKKA